jgi:hypothetical protein
LDRKIFSPSMCETQFDQKMGEGMGNEVCKKEMIEK